MSEFISFADVLEKGGFIDPVTRVRQALFFTNPTQLPEGYDINDLKTLDEDDIHIMDPAQKRLIFKGQIPALAERQSRSRQTCERLTQLAPAIANCFEARPDLVEEMTFRLWAQRESPDTREDSFVALSYCWSPAENLQMNEGKVMMPVPPLMFAALAAERQFRTTGIFIDQVCIDQKNKAEKATSVAAMDSIYRCAMMVVVALLDVEVTTVQQKFLQEFLPDYESPSWPQGATPHRNEQPPFLQQNPILGEFLDTVLSSRWFTRAWCCHEMESGEHFVFYIPCRMTSTEGSIIQMFGFSETFFWDMITLRSEVPGISSDRKDLLDRLSMVLSMKKRMVRVAGSKTGISEAQAKDSTHVLPYTTQVREIFALGAGGDPDLPTDKRNASAILDKSSIVLNTTGSGLSVVREFDTLITEDEAMKNLLILGLAAGDPSVLCTLGEPFNFASSGNGSSWVLRPSFHDLGSGPERREPMLRMDGRLLQSVSLDQDPSLRWIQLDVLGLGLPSLPAERYTVLAQKLVATAIELGLGLAPLDPSEQSLIEDEDLLTSKLLNLAIGSKWKAGRRYEYWQAGLTGDFRERFDLTVACVLECGLEWVLGTASRCGYPYPELLKQSFDEASEALELQNLDSMGWIRTPAGRAGVNSLLSMAKWMAVWTETQPSPDCTGYMPMMFPHGNSGGKAVVYGPTDALIQFVLPGVLIHNEYSRLFRIWLLAATDDPFYEKMYRGEGVEWFLRGKSILFTNVDMRETRVALGSARTADGAWVLREQVKVHGPPASSQS